MGTYVLSCNSMNGDVDGMDTGADVPVKIETRSHNHIQCFSRVGYNMEPRSKITAPPPSYGISGSFITWNAEYKVRMYMRDPEGVITWTYLYSPG